MKGVKMEVGDPVILKSGGPKMTINKINGNMVECSWFDEGKLNLREFPRETLIVENRNSNNESMLLG